MKDDCTFFLSIFIFCILYILFSCFDFALHAASFFNFGSAHRQLYIYIYIYIHFCTSTILHANDCLVHTLDRIPRFLDFSLFYIIAYNQTVRAIAWRCISPQIGTLKLLYSFAYITASNSCSLKNKIDLHLFPRI